MKDNNFLLDEARLDEDEGIGLDIKKLVAIFIDYWKYFLFCLLGAIGLAYLYLQVATPAYKVDATLMIQDPDKGGDIFSSDSKSSLSDLGDLFGSKSNVDNEAQVLQTSDLPIKVARDLKLYFSYYLVGALKNTELYKNSPFDVILLGAIDTLRPTKLEVTPSLNGRQPVLQITERNEGVDHKYSVEWDKPFKTVRGDSLLILQTAAPLMESARYVIRVGTLINAAQGLKNSLTVDIPNKQVSTINLELRATLRDKGINELRALINEYIRGNITQKNAFADSTIDFIDNRIAIVNDELNHIEEKVQQFKETNNIADIKEQADQIIDNQAANLKDLTQAETQAQIVDSAIKYLQDEHNNQRPVPSLLTSPDPTFLVLFEKYNTLQTQADKLSLASTNENPMVINLNQQIANLRQDLLTNLRNQAEGLKIGLAKLRAQNSQVNTFIKSAPEKERQYIGLSREQDIKQALFIYLLQKKEEVAVTKASNISSSVVIDTPKAAEEPSSPIKPIIYLLAILAGIGIPYLALLLRNVLNNKVSGPKDVVASGATLLGEIGHNFSGPSLVFKEKSRSVIAEQFRALRTNLQFALGESTCPVLLVTSSRSGEGKSFVSTNLGLAYASNGKKVLLMELDLRKPKLSAILLVQGAKGFSNYITSPLNAGDIISPTEASPSLDIVTSGPIPPNPAELLASPKTKLLIEQLKKQYDIIIIDTAPVGSVTDALILSPFADITLYIVRQDYTFKNQVGAIRHLIQSGQIARLYTVLNDAKHKTSSLYGYDSTNGYGYGYGYGYGVNERKPWWKRMLTLSRNGS